MTLNPLDANRNIMDACETIRRLLPPDTSDEYFRCLCDELTPIFQRVIDEAAAEKGEEIQRLREALSAIKKAKSELNAIIEEYRNIAQKQAQMCLNIGVARERLAGAVFTCDWLTEHIKQMKVGE